MKRKYGDGSSWKRLIEKSYTVKQVEEGMLGILDIKKVREPSCKEYDGEELCIAKRSVYVDSIFHRREKLCDYRYVR